ncbi:uncharacterized protein LOC121579111 [Coregonus clupeaformis]|uniref:uncharacterized protein LOC121579111 n=1 Tax=Coregonus clupeaformis TaxID=59861 RepID=UPI001E1C795A|nr:uncharacterized protein LOC121579111 [Coregonus clupeaformis]
MALVTVRRSPTPSTSSSPCVSESGSGEEDLRSQPRSISESFLTVKGAALFLPRGNGSSPSSTSRFSQLRSKHAGDLQQHLQTMFTLLRPEDNIKLAVRLESTLYQGTRYMVVVSTNGRQDTEESLVLGMDFSPTDSSCLVGLVLPLWSDTLIHLDGDGGFSVSTDNRVHVFKPVSVQAMWSALQSLHKACEVARCHNYYPGSLFLTWVSYYQSRVSSDQSRINEWNAMQDVQSHRADSPVLFSDVPTEREKTERLIKTRLREIMVQKDLENVTCKEIRTELEVHMVCNLREFKEYIDNEMILILGQMDSPTEIFDHVYLGSEWNASNLEELQNSGVQYILNVTKEIDNFFPGVFEYHNIRVYDEEATDLLAYWNDTYKFISRAKRVGAKCLVHCKMGVSRSASTVIAYAMKEYGWDLERAFDHVKERRAVTKPNPSFMRQLEEYQGILLASKQRHNKLWRSHSDSDLSEHHEPLCKTAHHPHTLGRSDPRNQGNSPTAPSLQELLHPSLGTPSNTGQVVQSVSECGTPSSAGKVVRSSSQPNTTVTRTEAQLTSTTGVQSVGSGVQSSHTVDQSAPSGVQSSHTVDQSAPSGVQSSHTVDQSAPSGVQSSHTVDQSAPSGVQSSHTVDQSAPSGVQSSHTVDQSAPSGVQSSHTVDQSAPSGVQSSHTVDQSAPSGVQSSHTVDQSAPSGVQSSHTVDQSAPSGDQSSHTVDQSAPSGDQSSHTVDQSAPSGVQSSHTVDQSAPSGVQSSHTVDQSAPSGVQSSHTVDQSAPSGVQSSHTVDQSAPSGVQSSHTVDQSAPSGVQSSHTVDQSAPSGVQSSHTVDQSAPSGVQSSHTVDQSAPSGVQSSHTVDQSAPSGVQSSHTVDQSAPSGVQSSHTIDQSAPSGVQSSHTVDQSAPSGVQSLDSPDSAPLAGSACPPSPPLSNGLCDSEEDPSTQSLPRPRAATVVPDVSTVTVVETVPVGRPHLPPSLHHLPLSPAPFPTPSGADETLKAKEPSSNLPGQKSRQSQVPELLLLLLLRTPVTSRQTAGSQELSAPVPYEKLHSDQRLPGVFLDSSGPQQPSSSEVLIISQPSAPLQDPVSEGSSALSTDRINFFSAREKFQDMTRDGRTRCFSDQALQQTPQPIPRGPGQEQQQEDPSAEATEEVKERKRENVVSVHLIVTELESLMHTVAPSPGPSSQPESTASQDQEMCQSHQEVEEKVAKSQQEVKAVKEEVKDKAKEMETASHSPPTPLSGDWAMGSVRRVTRQLEQRMRQEHGSPSPTPPSLPLDPSHHPASITPRHTAFCYAPLSSVDFLCLEGVTELESGTNWGSPPGRGRGDIMRETREMGAFRRQESGDGAKEPRCMGQVWGEGVEARQKGSRGGDRQRAREIEARIRRAGLTPPSLMKRSASLAKLGCLELSANDLSGWELSPTVEPFPPLVAADESSKKLRVLSHNAPCLTSSVSTSRPESLRTGGEGPCKGGHTPSEHLHSPPPDSGHAPSPMPDLIVVATRQQYGRTHPLHRLKKQTVSTLYHTM